MRFQYKIIKKQTIFGLILLGVSVPFQIILWHKSVIEVVVSLNLIKNFTLSNRYYIW